MSALPLVWKEVREKYCNHATNIGNRSYQALVEFRFGKHLLSTYYNPGTVLYFHRYLIICSSQQPTEVGCTPILQVRKLKQKG